MRFLVESKNLISLSNSGICIHIRMSDGVTGVALYMKFNSLFSVGKANHLQIKNLEVIIPYFTHQCN